MAWQKLDGWAGGWVDEPNETISLSLSLSPHYEEIKELLAKINTGLG
jgi:hypothetical protein